MATRFGRYELVRPLGRGGMAEVFLAVHRGPGGYEKRLVIKRVLPKLAADAHFLRLFFDEAKLHVQLSHGGLVAIFDFGRIGNDYFLAMEYVEGGDLAAVLDAAGGPLPPACVAFIGQELARVLAYVHRQGLVHRDVTPRNVLISSDGEVKLADFGVAQPRDTSTGGVRGTLAYMAPEQARGERVDARADLYALGIILAETATGRRVRQFEGDNDAKLALVAAARRVEIDGPFAAIVARATDPDPALRYTDVVELGAALEVLSRSFEVTRDQAASGLAARVRALVASMPSGGDLVAPSADGPATYFRDGATQASIVDEILAAPAVPARRRAVLPLALVLGAGVVAVYVLARPHDIAAPPPRPTESARVATLDAASPALVEVVPPVRPEPSKPPSKREAPTKSRPTQPAHAALVENATLRVTCSPWCVIEVDGEKRGEDGRSHRVILAPGRHHLVAHRLEDKQDRDVALPAGGVSDVALVFE